MDDNLLWKNGFGSDLVLQQIVFAHKHSVGEVGAVGEKRQLKSEKTYS